jgi:hypothetical protein
MCQLPQDVRVNLSPAALYCEKKLIKKERKNLLFCKWADRIAIWATESKLTKQPNLFTRPKNNNSLTPFLEFLYFFFDFFKNICVSSQILQNYTFTAIWYDVGAQTPYHIAFVNSTL